MEHKIFAKFKERYTTHPLPFDENKIKWYERMLGLEEKKHEYIKPPTKEQIQAYEQWKASRAVTEYALFPPDVKNKIQPTIEELLSLGIQNADLVGSFSRGDYCLNEADIAIKNTVKAAKLSDVDIVIHDELYEMPTTCDVLTNGCFYPTAIPIIRDGKVV